MAGQLIGKLIVVIEIAPDVATARLRLDALLGAPDIRQVSTVILAPPPGATLTPAVQPLLAAIQSKGLAALLHADARLARTLKADGIHLPASGTIEADYAEARDILGTRFIAGADAGRSRHDAMALGEAGADYVGFSPQASGDAALARDEHMALLDWWSEIFEVPCVALGAATGEDVSELLAAGADFVAVTAPGDLAPEYAASWLAGIAAVLRIAA